MCTGWRPILIVFGFGVLLLQQSRATVIPRLSFEQLTDKSEFVVSGHITSTWAAWDSEHKFIWTHYTMSVDSTLKGRRSRTLEFAEPGGAVNGVVLNIVGSVRYGVGDNVVVFLARMPNGYLRTTGWVQGRYPLDKEGRIHGQASAGPEMMSVNGGYTGLRLATLEGMSISDLSRLIGDRVNATEGRKK